MPVKVNRKHSGTASRERIVSTAVRLFARHGYAGTGLRELARSADVNLAMVNYFFGSKKGLLKEILDDFLSGYLSVARETLQGDDEPQVKVCNFISAAVTYFSVQKEALIVTITELPHDDPEIIAYKAAWGKQMMEIIEREICGPFSPESENRLSTAMIGPLLLSMMASRFLFAPVLEHVQPEQDILQREYEEYAAVLSRILLHGIDGSGTEAL
jgi:AcrR family transcriptional regulator